MKLTMLLRLQRSMRTEKASFVPQSHPVTDADVEALQHFLLPVKRLLVLTGAGLSTESGIPDYRSEKVGLYARTESRPIQYQQFIKCEAARQKYWARNFVGWPQFSSYLPNICHKTLAHWEKKGKILWLVTQNVDALHTKADSLKVTELHGCTHRVVCLSCDHVMSRWSLQTLFEDLNPTWQEETMAAGQIAPDGDVLLSDQHVKNFKVPSCPNCKGVLKPDVIFFGDNVPRPKVLQVFDKVSECDALLVAGSSLFVYSGYRFALKAAELGKPIAIVNIGETRADHLATLKINTKCGDILPKLNLFPLTYDHHGYS